KISTLLDNKEIVLIEVQVNSESDYFYRMLFGASKIIAEHLAQGAPYSQIKKVYSVNILYFDLGHGKDYIYHGITSFVGLHQNDILDLSNKQKELYQKQYVHQIYPEYYLIKVNQFNNIAKDTLDEWIYFLKNEEIKDNFHAKGLLEAKEKLDALKLPTSEKQAYKTYLENLHYEESMVDSSFNSGKLEGKKEGEKVGLKKGEKIGLEKGKLAVAKKMKASGMDIELIRQITGLQDFS
ncbi:MAG: PD-(D/E)XK nuclease family transposase, partial [Candidatus Cloacimonadota bacterium]|nr:PD-(D/E)XK nuclease family transposase [Candidatus Cloacimonadota bacterium]